jgi:hypothetical protein
MLHKQTLLRIGLPRGLRVYPSEFREMLAKVPNMPNALFHRDEDGETLNDRPGIRMVGAVGWVGIVADEENKMLLREATGAAILAVTERTGRSCDVKIEEHDFGITQTEEPRVYWVREMVLKRKAKARAQAVETVIEDKALTSIEAACEKYGMDCPTAEQLGIKTVEIVRERGMRLQTTSGVTNMWVTLVDAKVMIHANLQGHWFLGNLTSRGYGRVIQEREGFTFEPARKGEVLR